MTAASASGGQPEPGAVTDAAVVMDRCAQLARLTAVPGTIERLHLSPEHRAANDLVAEWMAGAGLTTWQDAAGNLCGRLEGEQDGLPALVLGSHLDTVPDAGAYDGVLGVLAGIAVAERLRRAGIQLPFALEVVAFSDEEGTRFGNALSGSRAFAGTWDPAWWSRTDADEVTLREALTNFGLDPDRLADAARRPEDLVGYLELHIEQAPFLEEAGRPLAAVTSIAGARRFTLTVLGHAGHAGGTPYERRRDALVAASELVLAVERIGRETGTVATVGRLQAHPGGVNVIPGRVEMSLDLRGRTDAARDDAWSRIRSAADEVAARRQVSVREEEIYRADTVVFDPQLRSAVEAGIRATGDTSPMELWSRAGHDGMAVQAVTGVAMLFVRCAGGISHHPDESVTVEDVAVALDAFEAAVRHTALRAALPSCLDVPRWVAEVAEQGPFTTLGGLLVAAREAADPLTDAEFEQALAQHPRIGERAAGQGRAQRFSAAEQSSPDAADAEIAAAIAEGNRAYEERFGRVFLIRAAGRSRAEILTELRRRLDLDEQTDREVAKQQLREIALVRLESVWAQLAASEGAV